MVSLTKESYLGGYGKLLTIGGLSIGGIVFGIGLSFTNLGFVWNVIGYFLLGGTFVGFSSFFIRTYFLEYQGLYAISNLRAKGYEHPRGEIICFTSPTELDNQTELDWFTKLISPEEAKLPLKLKFKGHFFYLIDGVGDRDGLTCYICPAPFLMTFKFETEVGVIIKAYPRFRTNITYGDFDERGYVRIPKLRDFGILDKTKIRLMPHGYNPIDWTEIPILYTVSSNLHRYMPELLMQAASELKEDDVIRIGRRVIVTSKEMPEVKVMQQENLIRELFEIIRRGIRPAMKLHPTIITEEETRRVSQPRKWGRLALVVLGLLGFATLIIFLPNIINWIQLAGSGLANLGGPPLPQVDPNATQVLPQIPLAEEVVP